MKLQALYLHYIVVVIVGTSRDLFVSIRTDSICFSSITLRNPYSFIEVFMITYVDFGLAQGRTLLLYLVSAFLRRFVIRALTVGG